jgi:LacI family transcriptional regulator
MSPRPTVYDVAQEAKVSIATVSRVLRHPEDVRSNTKTVVQDAIQKLGYVPSGSAQSLAARRTGTIGLFLPTFDSLESLEPFNLSTSNVDDVSVRDDTVENSVSAFRDPLYYDEVLRGCELEAWKQGFSLLVNIGHGHTQDDLTRIISAMAGKVDALIVHARSIPDSAIEFLARRIPIVVVADIPTEQSMKYDYVRASNRKGMKAIVDHLIEKHGITSFAYVAGSDDSPDNHKRFIGFEEGLSEHGINPSSTPIYRGQFSRQVAARITSDLIKDGKLPRALVCANDQMALGALDELNKAHIRVPDEVIITGFDGISETQNSRPRLTTVSQPMLDLGRAAVRTIIERLANPEAEPIYTELPVTLLLRESCEGTQGAA